MLYRLTLNRVRKINILGIFGVGTICICVATICFAQPASKHPGKCPGPLWLAIWSTVESAIGRCLIILPPNTADPVSAVVVGCLPTFGLLLPPIRSTSDPPYFHHGNNKKHSRSLSGTLESTLRDHSVDLRSSTSRVALGRLDSCNHGHGYMVTANDSKDRITWPFPGVMVTNTFEVRPQYQPFYAQSTEQDVQVDEPTLDALPPVTLPPQPSHQQGIP